MQNSTLFHKVENADICDTMNIESLLLRVERLQLRWYGHKYHVTRMSKQAVEGVKVVPEPIGKLRIRSVDLASEFRQSIFPSSQKINVLRNSN